MSDSESADDTKKSAAKGGSTKSRSSSKKAEKKRPSSDTKRKASSSTSGAGEESEDPERDEEEERKGEKKNGRRKREHTSAETILDTSSLRLGPAPSATVLSRHLDGLQERVARGFSFGELSSAGISTDVATRGRDRRTPQERQRSERQSAQGMANGSREESMTDS
jgi:ribosomal protein L13E